MPFRSLALVLGPWWLVGGTAFIVQSPVASGQQPVDSEPWIFCPETVNFLVLASAALQVISGFAFLSY
jgi:hypothetical protein